VFCKTVQRKHCEALAGLRYRYGLRRGSLLLTAPRCSSGDSFSRLVDAAGALWKRRGSDYGWLLCCLDKGARRDTVHAHIVFRLRGGLSSKDVSSIKTAHGLAPRGVARTVLSASMGATINYSLRRGFSCGGVYLWCGAAVASSVGLTSGMPRTP